MRKLTELIGISAFMLHHYIKPNKMRVIIIALLLAGILALGATYTLGAEYMRQMGIEHSFGHQEGR